MNKPFVRWILLAIKIVIAGIVMVWMFKGGKLDWSLILEGTMNPLVVVVGILGNLLLLSSAGLRWFLLLRGQGVTLRFRFVHYLTYITCFFNGFIPGGIGGDALRVAFVLKHEKARRGQAALTIVLDRVIGLFSMMLIAALFSLLLLDRITVSPPLTLLVFSTFLLVGIGPPVALLIFWMMGKIDRFPNWLKGRPNGRLEKLFRLLAEFAVYFNNGKKHVFIAILVSAVGQSLEILALLWIASNLSIHVLPFEAYFIAGPWAWLANILPVSPGGLGVGEAAFDQVCKWLSPGNATVAFGTIFLINRMCLFLASVPGLFFFLFRGYWLGESELDKKDVQ